MCPKLKTAYNAAARQRNLSAEGCHRSVCKQGHAASAQLLPCCLRLRLLDLVSARGVPPKWVKLRIVGTGAVF